jgi:hypothetical protein
MAASNTLPQKLALAQGFVNAATLLAQAWSEVQKYNNLYVQSGLTFASTDFNGTSFAYIDPANMGTLITNLNSFVTWMNSGGTFSGAQGGMIFQCTSAAPQNI